MEPNFQSHGMEMGEQASRCDESDFNHVQDDRLWSILVHWLRARKGALMPTVEELDPTCFADALPNVWLCEVCEDNPRGRFLYRLMGAHIRIAHGENLVGKTLEEVTDAQSLKRVRGYFDLVVDRPAIVHIVGRVYAEADRPAKGERIVVPFFDPREGRVTRVLGATVHSWQERGVSIGPLPKRQVRTFTPIDGTGAWCEFWI